MELEARVDTLFSLLQDLTNSEKIGEILYSLDDDSDGSADPWELHDWIVWVERAVHRHILDEQWGNFRQVVVGGGLAWGDYLSMVDPEQSPSHDMKRYYRKLH